jgi:MFS family permease
MNVIEKAEFRRIKSNIPKLYAFTFFQMFLVIIPVIVPFFQSKGLNLQQIFTLQGIFGGTLIIFDAPAGYLADVFGRQKTLLIGSIVSAIGFQMLWFGSSFGHYALYEIIIGIGLSLQSGCDVAILYNSLEKLRLHGSGAGYLGRRLTYSTIGEGMASLLGGFLAGLSLEYPAYAMAGCGCIPMFIAATIYEPPGQKLSRTSHIKNFQQIWKAVFGHSKLLTFAIMGFIFYGFATFVAVWSLQPYWQSRGLNFHLFGYLWAANNFIVAFVARYAYLVERRIGSIAIVVIIASLPVVGYFGMGLTPGLWGLLFTLSFPVCRALNQVIFQDAINRRVTADVRATVNSVASLGMRGLFVIFGPLVGRVLDTSGPDGAMMTLGWVYVGGILVVAVPLLSQRRSFEV